MLEVFASPLTDILAAVAKAGIHFLGLLFHASIRPWRYLLIPDYRRRVNRALAGRGWLYRLFYLFWGWLIVACGALLIWALAYSWTHQPEPHLSTRQQLQLERERALDEAVREGPHPAESEPASSD